MNTSAVRKKKTGNRSICYYDYDGTSAVFKRHALPKKKKKGEKHGIYNIKGRYGDRRSEAHDGGTIESGATEKRGFQRASKCWKRCG